ncbi:hypothetical protein HED49_20090 [Ochrobactrum daejeonense]|nr:hypothetical protein [Brucella daejeonensis]
MLIAAAAGQWGVDASQIVARESVLSHAASGKSATYGEFAVAASQMPVPDPAALKLKARNEYGLIGKRHHGVDDSRSSLASPCSGSMSSFPGWSMPITPNVRRQAGRRYPSIATRSQRNPVCSMLSFWRARVFRPK